MAARIDDPRERPKPIDEQIASAIGAGFETVLKDQRAIHAESIAAQRELVNMTAMLVRSSGPMSSARHSSTMPTERLTPPPQSMMHPGNTSFAEFSDKVQPTMGMTDRLTTPPMSGEAGFGGLGKQTRQGIRAGVFNTVQRHTSSWSSAPLRDDFSGVYANEDDELMGIRHGYKMDSTGRFHGPKGQYANPSDAVTAVPQDMQSKTRRRQVMAGRITDASQAWANGEPLGRSLMNAAPQSLLKGAGYAAVAVTAVDKGIEFVQSQAAANRGLQEYYGGNLGDQWGERGAQWVNKNITGRFSLLGGENYDKLFNQAMHSGLRGNQRADYIGTGADIMGKGVSAEQTGDIMSTALKSSQGLEGLAKSIQAVNNAAREASVSAVEARNIFIENYKASSDVLFGSGGAKQVATAFTQATVGMGKSYAGRVDLSGTMSINQNLANASRLGLTPSQYETAQFKNPIGGMAMNETRIKEKLSTLSPDNGGSMTIPQIVADFLASNPYDPKKLGEAIVEGGFSSYRLGSVLRANQYNTDDAAAPGVVAMLFGPGTSPAQIAVQNERSRTAELSGPAKTYTFEAADTRKNAANVLGTSQEFNSALKPFVNQKNDGAKTTTVSGLSPVTVEMLKQQEELGIGPNSKVRVQVTGKDGKQTYAVVSIQTAMRDFQDQIANGSFMFLTGGEETQGKLGSEVLNLPKSMTDVSAASTKTLISDNKDIIGTYDDWKDDEKKKKEDGGSTNVVIDLNPEIKRWFYTNVDGVGSPP